LKSTILVRYGEIALKGRNRNVFEQQLQQNLKGALSMVEETAVERLHGRLLVTGPQEKHDQMLSRLKRVFGVVSLSSVQRTPLELDKIKAGVGELVAAALPGNKSFKVDSRRSNKDFPYTSPQLNSEIGAFLQQTYPDLEVDLHNPGFTLFLEIGYEEAFIYLDRVAGPGGLPVGVSGKALLLLSGGIDSPVAGWLALKRGLELEALHFHSFPFTGQRSLQKAEDLCRRLALFGRRVPLHEINVAAIQKEIKDKCPQQLAITLLRRMMFRLAEALSVERGLGALVTGESLGQVASQTMESLQAIDASTGMLVLRPLITMDKLEIIARSEEIGTYDISIRPFEDCCTLFVPQNPATKPKMAALLKAESELEIDTLVREGLESLKSRVIRP